jgi:hypothetical protein
MAKRRKQRSDIESVNLFFHITVSPIYNACKTLGSNKRLGDEPKVERFKFALDLGWAGIITFLFMYIGGTFWLCYYIGGIIIFALILSYLIGKHRRGKTQQKTKSVNNQPELIDALKGLGFTHKEAFLGAEYATLKYPNLTFQEQMKYALGALSKI